MADVTIKTAHGYLSIQPDGRIEFRQTADAWETFTIEGLAPLSAPGRVADHREAPVTPVHVDVGRSRGLDAIDLSTAVVAANDCPDVRAWPIVTEMRSIVLAPDVSFERGDTMVDFVDRDTLPAANGTQGPIAYTLWMGCHIAGSWHLLPIVECIRGYVPTGKLLQPGQLPTNLFYYAKPPLNGYQPAPGERVAFFCTTGDTRRQNAQAMARPGRTNAVLVPFEVGTFQF